jgi:hypothetical protein
MKLHLAITAVATMLFTYAQGQVQLYLGARGGAGAMLTSEQLHNMSTLEGTANVFRNYHSYGLHAKGEALLGFKRLRVGYRFMYNFSAPSISNAPFGTAIDDSRYTTYFSARQTHIFAHYFVTELAVVNAKHFSLVPGVAVGSYTGYSIDNGSNQKVQLSDNTHHRFTVGAELNAEIKFGRVVFLFGPNYYLLSMQDKIHTDWRVYQHYIGADVGLRVNLLKP